MRKKQIIYLIFLFVSAQLTGHVYLAGYWRGPLDGFIPGGGIPSTDFSSTYGGNDGLVAKYDLSGNLLWAFKIGGEAHDYIHAIHLDIDGNIYITGHTSPGTVHFSGTGSLTSDSVYLNVNNNDFFLQNIIHRGGCCG